MVQLKKEIPNEETQMVIENSRKGLNVAIHDNLDDYFKKIEIKHPPRLEKTIPVPYIPDTLFQQKVN